MLREAKALPEITPYASIRLLLAPALLTFAEQKVGRDKVSIKQKTLGRLEQLTDQASPAFDLFEALQHHPKLLNSLTVEQLIRKYWPTPGEQLVDRFAKHFPPEESTTLQNYLALRDIDPAVRTDQETYVDLQKLLAVDRSLTQAQKLDVLDACLYLRKHDRLGFDQAVTDTQMSDFIHKAGTSKKDRLNRAGNLYHWLSECHKQDIAADNNDHRIVYSAKTFNPPKYSLIMENLLLPRDYDLVGKKLRIQLTTVSRMGFSDFTHLSYFKKHGYSPDAVAVILKTYQETGYVKIKDNGAMSLTADGRAAAALSGDDVDATRIAWRIKKNSTIKKELPTSLQEGSVLQDAWKAEVASRAPSTVSLKTEAPPTILNLKDVLQGYSGSDTAFVLETLDALLKGKSSPKPDIAILSGLMWGEYKNSKSDLRGRTVKNLDQYRMAKLLIDRLRQAGIHTVVNTSLEDAWIARDMTIDMLFLMQTFNKESETSHISYWQQNSLMTKEGDTYDHLLYLFCSKVAVPYFMQLGRSPLDSEGVNAIVGDRMHMPELFVLYDAWDKLTHGKPIPKGYLDIINPDLIPMPGKTFDKLSFTYGLNLQVTTPTDGVFTVWDVHDLGLTGVPQAFTTTDKVEAYVRNKIATGQPVPQLITTGHDKKFIVIRAGDTWIASDPAPLSTTDPVTEDGTRFSMSKDPGKRKINASEHMSPSNVRYHVHADGSLSLDLDTSHFRRLADLMEEDATVMIFGDQQVGSQTGDIASYQKLLWAASHQLPRQGATYLFDLGDNTQGDRLYKTYHAEGGLTTGLARVDQQALMFSLATERATAEIDPKVIDELKVFHRVIGNHQWLNDPMYPAFGAYLTNAYLAHNLGRTFEEGLDKARVVQQLKTEIDGVVPLMHAAYEQVGPYGVYLTHRFVEKNQKAGGKGKHPIHMAYPFEQGLAGELSAVNFVAMGDMHVPGFTEYNGRYYAIVPPLAKGSPYERHLALSGAAPGALEIQFKRKKLPRVTFWSHKRINDIVITSGPLSEERLADEYGFFTHPDFNPMTSHLYDPQAPKSALQQWILHKTTEITRYPDSTLPHQAFTARQ